MSGLGRGNVRYQRKDQVNVSGPMELDRSGSDPRTLGDELAKEY